ncbi:MAG: hypothetical protein QGG36_04430, partial [Pirellulaceae bacterium]|nr:hypothetical protein [Pirellulaceae bacterium]
YNSYIDDLSAADILWIDIPCPPRRNTDADRDRFVKERMLAREYLKTAIQNRRSTLPCSVMLALTKIDSRFSNAIEAKSRLTDQALAESFECPLDFLYECQRVCKASIVPVSSLGFDTTEVCDIAPPAAPDGRSDTLGIHVDEEKYVLRSGTAPRPFNLAPLLLMSLVCGLANKPTPAGQDQYEMADLLKSLCTDFDRLDGWHVPVNPARRSGTCRSASS